MEWREEERLRGLVRAGRTRALLEAEMDSCLSALTHYFPTISRLLGLKQIDMQGCYHTRFGQSKGEKGKADRDGDILQLKRANSHLSSIHPSLPSAPKLSISHLNHHII